MKKVVIGLVVAIIIVISLVGYMFWHNGKKNNKNVSGEIAKTEEYHGKRGNITETERIKFLSKNDEYLVGMMGLPVSNEEKTFTNDDMISFCLNIAVERYSTILDKKKTKDGTYSYLVDEKIMNDIAEEYFGISWLPYDQKTNEYYSTSNKAFMHQGNLEKTLYYYPVTQEKKDNGNIEIVADAIFISDNQEKSVMDAARYEGKYSAENVDNTIKFIFNSEGKLISYQYQ